jgi:hypothetical protein
MQDKLIVGVDFDGTPVTHEYPFVGEEVVGAVTVLKALVKEGHKLMLWTMRSGPQLEDAVYWFKKNGIELWGINENPEQHTWTKSKKQYANLYIDDAALGCPLIYPEDGSRPYVNWEKVHEILVMTGVLSEPVL